MNMMVRHRHLKLDQKKVDRTRKLIGAKTDQETVERALDVQVGEEPILRTHRQVRGVGGLLDVFGNGG